MMHELGKKGIATVLVVAMAVGLTACGGTSDTAGKEETEKHYQATYIDPLPSSFSNNMSGNGVVFKGDAAYYAANNEDGTTYGVYSYNLLTAEEKTIFEEETVYDAETGASRYYSNFSIDGEGNVYIYVNDTRFSEETLNADYSDMTMDDVLALFMEWGYDEEMAQTEWDEYYAEQYTDEAGNVNYKQFFQDMNAQYENVYSVKKYDTNGNEVYAYEMPTDEGINSSSYGMVTDEEGYLYLSMNEWSDDGSSDEYYTLVLNKDGTVKGRINSNTTWISRIISLADGGAANIAYGESGVELRKLDPETLSEGEPIAISTENVTALDATHLLMVEGGTLYSYNMEDGTKEAYFSWMDCNISSSSVMSYGVLSDGTIGVYMNSWRNSTGVNISELAIIKEVDASEVADITYLNIACYWLDSDVEEKAIEFNKTNDKYHINIREYYDESMDYEDSMNAFTTAVAADSEIDVVIFSNYAQVVNFAAKGLLADMYDVLDADAELSRETFLPNILSASEYDGSLVMLPTRFTLNTVIAKTEDVGAESGWTLEDMNALLASKPEGTQLFYGMTRQEALNLCLSLGYNDYIDWENTTCSFNSEEFIDVLEFANMFPEEFQWNEEDDESVLLNTGRVLLSRYQLGDFQQNQMYEEIYGGPLTYVGYPTSEGNGALLSLQNMYGITKNCEDKEAAWKFVRQFFLPEDSENEYDYYYGFSALQEDFDAYCEEAMKEDENNRGSWQWGDFMIEIQPATQEQVDKVKNLVANTTAIEGATSIDIMNIIIEEAEAYFSGQKSAQDVADIIQSRMQVYLSETK